MTNEQPQLNPDIIIGNATVVGTSGGWAIPGGRIVRDKTRARMYARRMNRVMGKLEVVK